MARTSANKLIVVTGATRGIGRAMTEKFIALGHTVQGCGRGCENINQLRQTFGAPHDFAIVDVAREEQVESWTARPAHLQCGHHQRRGPAVAGVR
jgi:NADP-dependent 3-hydroxy acid dehydrogenase YdfG